MIFLEEDKIQEIMVGPFVDEVDGVTPKTGIVWNNANIEMTKWVGVVPTSTQITDEGGGGVNEITELQDGYYRIKLTATNLDTPGIAYLTFRDDDVFLPVMHSFMVLVANVFQSFVLGSVSLTDHATIKNRLGSWTGSGENTVLGGMKATLRKDLSVPSDLNSGGGVYSAAMDSQEAQRDRQDAIAAGSTLSKLNASITTLSTAAGVTSSVSTSTAVSDLSPRAGGFLSRMFSLIRKSVDEPSTLAKYKDSDLLNLMNNAWPQLWADLKLTSDNSPRIYVDLVLNTTDLVYQLPANLGEIHRLAKINDDSGTVEWEVYPRGNLNPYGFGWRIVGPTLELSETWGEGQTMRLEYIPSGVVKMCEGNGKVTTTTRFTIDAASDFVGTLDRRDNAYAGHLLRVFGGGGTVIGSPSPTISERLISASDTGGGLTLSPEMDEVAGTRNRLFEIVPYQGEIFENILGLNVSRRIHANQANEKAFRLLTQQYNEDMRAVRIFLTNLASRRADHQTGGVPEHAGYGRRLY